MPKTHTYEYALEVEQDDTPIRGHFTTDEPARDRELEDELIARLDSGDVWAWCSVRVIATRDDGRIGRSDWLGGCSYASEADYRACSGYFDDQCHEAISDADAIDIAAEEIVAEHTRLDGQDDEYWTAVDAIAAKIALLMAR